MWLMCTASRLGRHGRRHRFGTAGTDWANDSLFGEGFELFGQASRPSPAPGGLLVVGIGLEAAGCTSLIDGIVAGVGAVLGFVPQMLVLFVLLSFLEDCGYMARVAFVMDRIFRRFGLSGKSFIPMLVGTGCGVPGVMASRTIENERDRRMTVMTTCFIPCGAKLPIIAPDRRRMFGDAARWIAPLFYFLGVAAIIISGIMLKKTKLFAGDPLRSSWSCPLTTPVHPATSCAATWERGWSFIKRAGTIILLHHHRVVPAGLRRVDDGAFGFMVDGGSGQLRAGLSAAPSPWIFARWASALAGHRLSITGLIAKENVVGHLRSCCITRRRLPETATEIWTRCSPA